MFVLKQQNAGVPFFLHFFDWYQQLRLIIHLPETRSAPGPGARQQALCGGVRLSTLQLLLQSLCLQPVDTT